MEILSSILYYPIGYIYLHIRYGSKLNMKKVLEEKYDNSYYEVGSLILGKLFGVVIISLILLLIVVTLASVVFNMYK